jgi:WhiB family transcriptional regulator, redox-sensing transcriptional regulator
MTWRDRALCANRAVVEMLTGRDYDPDLWFPEGDVRETQEKAEAAKKVCAACPVSDPCLSEALPHPSYYGIWGGTTDRQRSRMRSRLGIAPAREWLQPCGTEAAYKRHRNDGEVPCGPCREAADRARYRRAS